MTHPSDMAPTVLDIPIGLAATGMDPLALTRGGSADLQAGNGQC